MKTRLRGILAVLGCAVVFSAGWLGGAHAGSAAQANKFGQPKTILQVSLLKWRPGVLEAEKQRVLEGVRQMAGQIPGIKNIWLKATRMQPRNFDAAFVIEFESREAAENYVFHPVHEAWSKKLVAIREDSLSPQITNE